MLIKNQVQRVEKCQQKLILQKLLMDIFTVPYNYLLTVHSSVKCITIVI